MMHPNASYQPAPTDNWRSALRGLRGGLIACVLFSFAMNLLMFAVPLHSMQLSDRVLASGYETLLLSLIAGLALLALGSARDGADESARPHRLTLRGEPRPAREFGERRGEHPRLRYHEEFQLEGILVRHIRPSSRGAASEERSGPSRRRDGSPLGVA